MSTLLISLMFVYSLQANELRDLAREYLGESASIQQSEGEVEAAKEDQIAVSASKRWALSLELDYTDTKLETSSFFVQNPSESIEQTLSLSGDFKWGGNLSFEQVMGWVDDKESGISFLGVTGKYYQFSQTLSYTQNLWADQFGRQFKKQLEIQSHTVKVQNAKLSKAEEEGLLSLTKTYRELQYRQKLAELQEQALGRAVQRRRLISKRVKDGLKERVDLLQSQISEANAREARRNALVNKDRAAENLSTVLHRPIDKTREANLLIPVLEAGGDLERNFDYMVLQDRIELAKHEFQYADQQTDPEISLNLALSNNDYDEKILESYKNGALGRNNRAVVVGVELTSPLSFAVEKASRAKAQIQKHTLEFQLKKLNENLKIRESHFETRKEMLSLNIKSAEGKIQLAEAALKEYNRLYDRGRADLDQVIRAEEDLIRAQTTKVDFEYQLTLVLTERASLFGKLKEVLYQGSGEAQ